MIMLKGEQKLLEKLEEFHSLSFEHQMNYDALAFGNVSHLNSDLHNQVFVKIKSFYEKIKVEKL